MAGVTVRVEQGVRPVRSVIDQGIRAFNASKIGAARTKSFAIGVRDDGGAILGGCSCTVRRGWLFVDTLWLEARLRGQDYGTAVMDLAEANGRKLGAYLAYLDTNSFQARPFYEKRGYRVFGRIDDPRTGHSRYWMTKALSQDTGCAD